MGRPIEDGGEEALKCTIRWSVEASLRKPVIVEGPLTPFCGHRAKHDHLAPLDTGLM